MPCWPTCRRGVGIVLKLASEADIAPVTAQFAVTRRTAIVSFTTRGAVARAAGVLALWLSFALLRMGWWTAAWRRREAS